MKHSKEIYAVFLKKKRKKKLLVIHCSITFFDPVISVYV